MIDGEVNVPQHRFVFVVSEGHVVKRDLAASRSRLARIWTFRNYRVRFEDRLNALDTNRSLRDGIGHLGEILHRLEEFVEVRKKDGQRAHRHGSGQNEGRAMPKHDCGTQSHSHGDDGREQRLHFASLERSIDGGAAYFAQFLLFQILPAECLHDAH